MNIIYEHLYFHYIVIVVLVKSLLLINIFKQTIINSEFTKQLVKSIDQLNHSNQSDIKLSIIYKNNPLNSIRRVQKEYSKITNNMM